MLDTKSINERESSYAVVEDVGDVFDNRWDLLNFSATSFKLSRDRVTAHNVTTDLNNQIKQFISIDLKTGKQQTEK